MATLKYPKGRLYGKKAMDRVTEDFSRGNKYIPDRHGNFFIAPITIAIPLYSPHVSAAKVRVWKDRMVVPRDGKLSGPLLITGVHTRCEANGFGPEQVLLTCRKPNVGLRIVGKKPRGIVLKIPMLSFKSIERWRRTDGTWNGSYYVTKNHFDNSLQAVIRGRVNLVTVIHSDGWRGYKDLVMGR